MGHQRLTVAAKSDFLQMRLPSRLFLLLLAICMLTVPTLCMPDHHPPTPIIGGLCKLGSPDIQIGGKQTQFFLRCEPEPESAPGEGIWAVKSKNTGTTPTKFPAAEVVKNAQQQQQQQPRKSAPKITSYTCDLVTNAYEHGFCETDENCLQPIYLDRNAFLQCDSTTRRWVKRHCQPGFNFDFERQACIAHTTVKPGHTFRQFPNSKEKKQLEEDNFFAAPLADSVPETKNRHNSAEFVGPKLPKGIVCTFAQCSADKANGDGCNVGTCNNGYCCSAAVGALPTANFPADHTKLADHPQPTTNWTSTSSTTPPPTVSAPLPMMPPSILVIALNEQQQPSGQQLPWNDDHFGGSSISLQKILATLQHQRAFPRAEPLPELCSTGFRSPIRCSASSGECPPGLACDLGPKLCCPIPLAKAQKQPKRQSTSHGNTKWPNANLEGNAQEKQNGRRRMALRRRLARKHFHSFFGCGGTSALGGCCSPCMPVNLLVSDQNPLAINPNLFTANFLTDSCPGGVPPLTSCGATGYCAPPLQCYPPGICCSAPALPPPVLAPPPPAAYACPGGLPALGQCIGGRCLSPAAVCTSPANVCCAQAVVPAAIPATVCPDGTQAAGACVNNMCGAGFTCNQGLCCTNSSQTPRCLDGSQSIGACIQGRCGTGYTCTTGNICCPSQLNPCPPGQVSIGLAVNGRCPSGYTNINGQCCGTQSQQSQISCPEIDSTGPCDSNQQCPEPGFACDTANNWCCPQVFENEDAIGPCIQGEGGTRLCPEGYACVGEGEGECRRLDTGTCPPDEQLGPCGPNNECPNGYECLEGFCCRIDNSTRFRRKRSPQSAFLRLVRGTRK